MAAAAQALPDRGQPILPPNDVWIRRTTVLDEQQTPTGSQHPTHVAERSQGIGNVAQGPSRHDGVDARVLKRNSFGRALDKFYGPQLCALSLACHGQEPRRGFEADYVRYVARIEQQVEPRADANFEHAALGRRDDTAAIGSEISPASTS
jgi:hypothetical protein